ncbi:MAG TPA: hypothetical protein VG900_08630 [Hyphomicrobiaceae bacterium]|nr:hypothetical protein [Hyphomicrobiaceae bacterium]
MGGGLRQLALVPAWQALALLLLAALAIDWPWLSGRVTIPWDAKAHFQPQIAFLAHCLASGESPFWAPYVFSGHPQIADPQSMIFSPPFLVLALFDSAPSLWAVDTTLLVTVALGGAALMVWFRDRGWHWIGGLIAALAFCYGGSMAWRVQHFGQVLSLTYVPIAMLCLDRAMHRSRGAIAYGVAGGVAAACILMGRDQVALLCAYYLVAFVLWGLFTSGDPRARVRAAILPLGAGAVATVLLAAVPVLLTALLAAGSNRPTIGLVDAGRGSLHPALLLTLVAPDVFGAAGHMENYWGPPSFVWPDTGLYIAQNVGELYLGALPLLTLAFAALRGDLWAREVRFFTVAGALVLLYALGWYTPVFHLLYALLPGVDLYRRPADATFLVGALGAILAGYGAHRLIAGGRVQTSHLVILAAALAACALLALGFALRVDRVARLALPLTAAALSFAAGGIALAVARPRVATQPLLAAAILVAVTAADLAYNNGPSTSSALPPSTYEVLEPDSRNATIAILKSKVVDNATRRDRVELAGLGFHWPNASLVHRLENTLGYNPLRLGLYSEATGAEDAVGLPDQRRFSPLFPSYRSTLADLLGLRFIATGVPVEQMDKRLQPGDLPLVARTSDGYIYENPRAMPRVTFAHRALPADFSRMLHDGIWPAADLANTVLLAHVPARPAPGEPGTARILSYRNTQVVVEADSPAGGWVVLNDVWQPWWFADVDGAPTEMLRANVLFRAVAVPPGRHRVRFTFRPLVGAWAALTHLSSR